MCVYGCLCACVLERRRTFWMLPVAFVSKSGSGNLLRSFLKFPSEVSNICVMALAKSMHRLNSSAAVGLRKPSGSQKWSKMQASRRKLTKCFDFALNNTVPVRHGQGTLRTTAGRELRRACLWLWEPHTHPPSWWFQANQPRHKAARDVVCEKFTWIHLL